MAKAARKTLDENGNLVDIATPEVEIQEVADIKIDEPKKKVEPKEYIFQLTQKFYMSNANRPPYPENFFLRNTDIIYDEESGTERNIRYLEGVNTIFEDEQEHLSDAKKNQRPQIRFTNGYLRVASNKTSLVKFLTSSNMFDKKKQRMESVLPVYTLTKGQAIWGDSKKFIAQIPDKAEPLKFLSELCLTEKGKDFYSQLKSMAD